MLDNDFALAFIQFATANEDRAFEAILDRVQPQPVRTEPTKSFDPDYSTCESTFYFLIKQEHKMEEMNDWPDAIRDHEEARTAKIRKALQDKFGDHYAAWYEKMTRNDPHLA